MIHPNDQSNPNYKTKHERLSQTGRQFLAIFVILIGLFSMIIIASLAIEAMMEYSHSIIDDKEMASVEGKPVETGTIDAHYEREIIKSNLFDTTVTHTPYIEIADVEYEIDKAVWSKLEKDQTIQYQITDSGNVVNITSIDSESP